MFSRLTPNQRGALWLLASSLVFATMNSVIKTLGGEIPLTQVMLFRCFFGLMALLPFILHDPRGTLAISRPWLHGLRALLGMGGMTANFWTVTVMPLATATTLFFTKALFMILLAALFLGERIRWRRSLATAAGFMGVLIMLDPQGGAAPLPVAGGLAGGACVALVMVVIKKLAAFERPMAVLVWFSLLSTLMCAPLAYYVWVPPNAHQFGLLVSLGAIGSLGQYLMIRAYRVGEATAVTPMDYGQLVFAGLFGLIFFDELLSLRALLGASVVVAATLYITVREARLKGQAESRPEGGNLL
jgi:drug/metabolite transporter (DMT)-like permease